MLVIHFTFTPGGGTSGSWKNKETNKNQTTKFDSFENFKSEHQVFCRTRFLTISLIMFSNASFIFEEQLSSYVTSVS